AIDAGRFRHLDGKRVGLEAGIGEGARRGLSGLGHVIVGSDTLVTFGGAQAVRRLERGWAGASDPRKDGMAAGYWAPARPSGIEAVVHPLKVLQEFLDFARDDGRL